MLCCVTADVANKIAGSNEHMQTLVRCCQSSGHEGVKSEASRILALIVKQSRAGGKLHGQCLRHFSGNPVGCKCFKISGNENALFYKNFVGKLNSVLAIYSSKRRR